ncbi:MAG: hypothetical protein ACRD4I_06160, partial [Candidatus Angelobacter sp.]
TATRKDLQQRLGSERGAKLSLSSANMFGTPVVYAVQTRAIALGKLHPQLKGVVALSREPVMVGESGGRAAIMGAVPHVSDTDREVWAFVESLLTHRRIKMGKKQKGAATTGTHRNHTTHVVKTVGRQKVLQRTSFQCMCHRCD